MKVYSEFHNGLFLSLPVILKIKELAKKWQFIHQLTVAKSIQRLVTEKSGQIETDSSFWKKETNQLTTDSTTFWVSTDIRLTTWPVVVSFFPAEEIVKDFR